MHGCIKQTEGYSINYFIAFYCMNIKADWLVIVLLLRSKTKGKGKE